MNDDIKHLLNSFVDEIEGLRAEVLVATSALKVLPSFSLTEFDSMKDLAIEKNKAAYDALRESIQRLT